LELLSWREVDLSGVILAGLVAGYAMALAGLWCGRIPGLVAVDIADYGRRYMVSDRPSAWLFGMASHLANSVVLVLAWAMLIEPNLDWPRPLEGLLWGEALALTLAGALVAPLTGIGFLGYKTGNPRFAVTHLLMHAVWGLLVGAIYVPR
jgi:integral membrane sensor domain MASE1